MKTTAEERSAWRAAAEMVARKRLGQSVRISGDGLLALLDDAEAGERFKQLVQAHLDAHGVPADDPNNEHSKQGCRSPTSP